MVLEEAAEAAEEKIVQVLQVVFLQQVLLDQVLIIVLFLEQVLEFQE